MGKNILIVEDDSAIRQTVKDILEIQGYTVEAAANGKEGLQQLEVLSPPPSLILLDLMMPTMSGWQFLDVQRNDKRFQRIPVVICSAYEESAKSVHPAGVVTKPIQLDKLLGAVRAFCQ